uniref:Ion_trans domain-containing protein n=1 Tax=Trichobilharzia regenti TaxID=157069 RepID=A0AA85JPF1_TRIRE|nr:unnamed protein product [Trichobilharzia regenti]
MDDPHVSTSDDSEITLDNAKQPNWLMRNENKHNTSVIQLPERQNHIRKRLPGENYSASQTNTPLLYNSSNAYTYHKDENNVDKQKLNPLNTTLLPSSTSRSQSPMDTTNILPKSKWKSTSSFYFNPSGRIVYSWCGVISVVFMYHLWVIMYRFAFNEINQQTVIFWLTLDYFADLLYLIDMTISIRTGFLEDGVCNSME